MIPPLDKTRRDFFCPNCQTLVALNVHGRCQQCSSDNVIYDLGTQPAYWERLRGERQCQSEE